MESNSRSKTCTGKKRTLRTTGTSKAQSLVYLLLSLCLIIPANAQNGRKKGGKKNSKDSDTWTAEEYSGLRGEKELRAAMASKGFTWITGSPTVYAIASESQRDKMARAVAAEKPPLKEWWIVRGDILTLLEDHLYTGEPINRKKLSDLGERFSLLNALVAICEARAFAEFEASLNTRQLELLKAWRADPESAGKFGNEELKRSVQWIGRFPNSLDESNGKWCSFLYHAVVKARI